MKKNINQDIAEIRKIVEAKPEAVEYLTPFQKAIVSAICQTPLREIKGNTTTAKKTAGSLPAV